MLTKAELNRMKAFVRAYDDGDGLTIIEQSLLIALINSHLEALGDEAIPDEEVGDDELDHKCILEPLPEAKEEGDVASGLSGEQIGIVEENQD